MPAQIPNETEQEITNLLRDLIRINTTNPPGNEIQAAAYIAKYLSDLGLSPEVFESAPKRGSVVARLKGTGEKPSLLLLSHLDVVAANPQEWTLPPFDGVVKDGYVYGRGAYDMKCMTAIELMVIKLLIKNQINIKGDIVLAATADEEQGGEAGAGFLIRNYKEKVWCPYVINEGGGLAFPSEKGYVFPIQSAEKGILWLKIKARGTPGHGSTPNTADNALLRINQVINKLTNYKPPTIYVPTLKQFLATISNQDPELEKIFERLLSKPRGKRADTRRISKKGPCTS